MRAEFVVDTAGHAGGIRILSAPDADHARVVSRSLPEWSFTPGILNGEAVQTATVVTAPVTF